MSPFIVTAPAGVRATETFHETHKAAREACLLAGGSVNAVAQCVRDASNISHAGGTITLPDGSTVEVIPASYLDLWLSLTDEQKAGIWPLRKEDWPAVVEAFNAAQEARAAA